MWYVYRFCRCCCHGAKNLRKRRTKFARKNAEQTACSVPAMRGVFFMQTEKTRHLRTRVISVLLAVLMIVTCLPSMLFPVSADNNGRSGGPLVLTNASIEFRDSKYNPIPDPEKGKEGVESGDLFYLMATISGNNVNEGEEDTYRIEITDQNLLLPNFAGNGFRDATDMYCTSIRTAAGILHSALTTVRPSRSGSRRSSGTAKRRTAPSQRCVSRRKAPERACPIRSPQLQP